MKKEKNNVDLQKEFEILQRQQMALTMMIILLLGLQVLSFLSKGL